jgi:hypothetical protein
MASPEVKSTYSAQQERRKIDEKKEEEAKIITHQFPTVEEENFMLVHHKSTRGIICHI